MDRQFTFGAKFVALLALAAVWACSASEEDGGLGSVDQFCKAKADAECVVAAKCAATTDACLADRQAACTSGATAAQSGGRTYTSGRAQACVDKTKEIYDRGTASPADLKALEEACERVFQGSIEQNKACSTDYNCKDSLICDKGFCATKVEKKTGEPCANPGDLCEAGSYCTSNGSLMVCTSKKGAGEVCNDAISPCSEEYRCNGTCVARYNAGETCDSNKDECAASAPYCDPTISKCTAGVGFSAGAPICKDYGAN